MHHPSTVITFSYSRNILSTLWSSSCVGKSLYELLVLSLKPGHQAYRSPPRFRIGVPPLSGLLTCYAETTVGFGIVVSFGVIGLTLFSV